MRPLQCETSVLRLPQFDDCVHYMPAPPLFIAPLLPVPTDISSKIHVLARPSPTQQRPPVPNMVSAFSVEVTLPIPRQILWRVRASRAFMDFMVSNGALNRMDATPPRPAGGTPNAYTRVQTYVPANIAIPDIVKTVFDDSYIEISDTQTWDDVARPFEQHFEIRPSVMADLVKSKGKLVVTSVEQSAVSDSEQKVEKACRHVLSGECSVGIPFLGWYVEQAIIANMQTFYKDYPMHIQQFAEMAIKRWGDGSDNLQTAVRNMLAEEKN